MDVSGRTITARIAVCVDPKGNWSAAGWGDAEQTHHKEAMSSALDGVGEGEARYWVEVELQLPTVPVVNAVAESAE